MSVERQQTVEREAMSVERRTDADVMAEWVTRSYGDRIRHNSISLLAAGGEQQIEIMRRSLDAEDAFRQAMQTILQHMPEPCDRRYVFGLLLRAAERAELYKGKPEETRGAA